MSPQPFYLGVNGESFLAQVHEAQGDGAPVLLCPLLGWDDTASYRIRFAWGEHLAARGHTTLRLDLPGTGDSAGSADDPGRVDAWTAAIGAAASRLRASTGRPVTAIGIGGAGLVLWKAVAEGAPVDGLILWGTHTRGSAFTRELRAFARLEALALEGDVSQVAPGGFLFTDETLADLEAIDLAELPLPENASKRALLLERDGLPVDDRLATLLGGDVTTAPGVGYGEMLAEPGVARPPVAVFELVDDWLDRSGGGSESSRDAPQETSVAIAAGAREWPLEITHDGLRLAGVVTEPAETNAAGLCAVFLNSGAIRRIGPGRMYVTLARRWAERGLPSLRLDLAGIGDSDGDAARFVDVPEFYEPDFAGQISAALDALSSRLGFQAFLLVGLCSGGYWSFEGALRDERVAAVAAVNPGALVWSRVLLDDRRLQPLRQAFRTVRSPDRLLRIARVVSVRLRGRVARRLGGDRLDRSLDRLRGRGTAVLLVFAEAEPQLWELERDGHLARRGRWPNLSVERIRGRDHTLRPAAMQAEAQQKLDRFVDGLLGRAV